MSARDTHVDPSRTQTAAAEEHAADPERARLRADGSGVESWKHWGPYLSERQWGTVREDYSAAGTAWEYFPHDHARSRAYRWGEDGIAGFSDEEQRVCLSLALWNERVSILKERLFGLTNEEGNHGEDVKEEYFYLDAVPSHAYLKMLYKYPQAAFPYAALASENARRGTELAEYELRDTGVLAGNRYFDVFVEYAQAEPGDILMKISAWNRGPESAPLHLVPQLVLRNTWSWDLSAVKPELRALDDATVGIEPADWGMSRLYVESPAVLLFTENESNPVRLWNIGGAGYFKDAYNTSMPPGSFKASRPPVPQPSPARLIPAFPLDTSLAGALRHSCQQSPRYVPRPDGAPSRGDASSSSSPSLSQAPLEARVDPMRIPFGGELALQLGPFEIDPRQHRARQGSTCPPFGEREDSLIQLRALKALGSALLERAADRLLAELQAFGERPGRKLRASRRRVAIVGQ